ncbi:uncharacterized protein Z519_03929 [Cladophialophora bantiana CBS 173.52]|uniref:PNPLA domain-containing protein n=1 Tax=Cladophialophora bantiana (strain ATCC 10958 / CBS 173.52 / CDC B-1940 / NIH 8579) TaxID=1442370 RepID=A0A0D2HWN3_CLAB1|nr:uncharacterized protein Z519_03929 [Cladophialophora bantiana CBS 173.52]KIW95345.1 hypothetical protein Z519_03929 [Cladophialophora bantiana CBS 173.52]
MSIEDAIEAYKDLSGTIFAKKWWAGNKITRLIGGEAKQYAFSGEPIKQGVRDVLEKQGLDSDVALLESEESSCRTFVSAVNAVTTHAELLRTYRLNKPGQTHYPCTVWEAARATSAAPMYFEPIEIGGKIKTTFVDGGLRDNNPVGLVTAEAHRIWPGRKIGCLVSLGTGVTQPESLSVTKSRLHEVLTTLASMTTDAHNRHLEFRNSEEGRGLLNDKKYFRFSPTQGFGQVSMEDFEKADSMVQFARDYVREHDDAFEHCVALLGSLSTGIPFSVSNTPSSPNPPSIRLHPKGRQVSKFYVGRDVLTRSLDESCLLQSGSTRDNPAWILLWGLGGTGKTEAAWRFYSTHHKKFLHSFWIDSGGTDQDLTKGFLAMAEKIGLGKEDPVSKIVAWLGDQEHAWLLVLDDVVEYSNLISCLPSIGNGVVLVTSTNRISEVDFTQRFHLSELDPEEAMDLLVRRMERPCRQASEREVAVLLLRSLCHLPLAIHIAGAYIRDQKYTIQQYHSQWRQYFWAQEKLKSADSRIAATFQLSYDRIANQYADGRSTVELLTLLCFLRPQNASEQILDETWHVLYGETGLEDREAFRHFMISVLLHGESDQWDRARDKVRNSLALLESYSFLVFADTGDIYVHSLVHEWCRRRLTAEDRAKWWNRAAVTLLLSASGEQDGSFYRKVASHLDHLARLDEAAVFKLRWPGEGDEYEVARRFVDVYQASGRFSEAYRMQKQICERLETCEQRERPSQVFAESLYVLSSLCTDAGDDEEALRVAQQALMLARKRCEPATTTELLICQQRLAECQRALGQFEAAYKLRVQILDGCKHVLRGEGDLGHHELRARRDVAISLADIGKHDEALQALEKITAEQKNCLSSTDQDLLVTRSALARAYSWTGLEEKALEQRNIILDAQKIRDEDHTDTLVAMQEVAGSLSKLGFSQRALEINQDLVQKWTAKNVPKHHRGLISAQINLAQSFLASGQLSKGLQLHREVLAARKVASGPQSGAAVDSMTIMTLALHRCGHKDEAAEMRAKTEKILNERPNAVPEHRRQYWKAMNSLMQLDGVAERIRRRKDILRSQEVEDDVGAVRTVIDLARDYIIMREFPSAIHRLETLLGNTKSKTKLGEHHPLMLDAMQTLIKAQFKSRQLTDAVGWLERLLRAQSESLGRQSPETIRTARQLTAELRSRKRDAAAQQKAAGLERTYELRTPFGS